MIFNYPYIHVLLRKPGWIFPNSIIIWKINSPMLIHVQWFYWNWQGCKNDDAYNDVEVLTIRLHSAETFKMEPNTS